MEERQKACHETKDKANSSARPAVPPTVSGQESLVIRTIAYVEGLRQAWFAATLEQTKSIFTLASADVGLALTPLFTGHREINI
jgi:hypothetical protein